MLFAHILPAESDKIVGLNASKFATENGMLFALNKVAYDKVCEIADALEQSIVSAKVETNQQVNIKKDNEGQEKINNI